MNRVGKTLEGIANTYIKQLGINIKITVTQITF